MDKTHHQGSVENRCRRIRYYGFVVSGKLLYAATADGDLFRSTDMGNFWKSIKHEMMHDLDGKLAALENTIFYIGSNSPNGRVFSLERCR